MRFLSSSHIHKLCSMRWWILCSSLVQIRYFRLFHYCSRQALIKPVTIVVNWFMGFWFICNNHCNIIPIIVIAALIKWLGITICGKSSKKRKTHTFSFIFFQIHKVQQYLLYFLFKHCIQWNFVSFVYSKSKNWFFRCVFLQFPIEINDIELIYYPRIHK